MKAFLRGFIEEFGDDLGLRTGLLYIEHRGRFQLVAQAGVPLASPRETLQARTPCVAPVVQHHVYIFSDPSEASSPSRAGVFPQGAAASVLIELPPARFLFFFLLAEGWRFETLDFSLNTLRAALTARLMEVHVRGTLQEAAAIQQSLLPRGAPRFQDYDVAARSQAAEEVGGDFFDFLPFEGEILGLAIGDVSGHGLPAALMARDVLMGLRMGIEREMKVTYVLAKLNRVIHASSLSSRFTSLFYGELEANGSLLYANAGHEPPLLFLDDRVVRLPTGDTVIGPLPEIRFKRRFTHLDRGGLLVLYTDGLVERQAPQGELFGLERLQAAIKEAQHLPSSAIIEQVFRTTTDFGEDAPWEDDATIVVVKRPR
ncbi:MAG: PP2C family protein-serine/threonine phosphatase [Planctomycetota bacterium]